MMKTYLRLPFLALCAFLGGFTAQVVLTSTPTQAAAQIMSYFKLSDPSNPRGLEMYVNKGTPAQNFYAYDGQIRLQMGLYTAPGERDLPMMAMSDNSGNLRTLLRLAGPNQAPVLIFKDKQHRDRMIIGLAMTGDESPFIVTYDSKGQKTNVLGNY